LWVRATFAENGLRSQLPEITCLAVGCCSTELWNCGLWRN